MTIRNIIKRSSALRRILAVPIALHRRAITRLEAPYSMIIKRLDETIIGDVSIFVKEFDGIFNINPRSDLFHRIIRHDHYEPKITAAFLKYVDPDRDIIDVGANIGFFTIAGAKALRAGRLLAVEPTRHAFDRLRQNVESNGVAERTILLNCLLSNETSTVILHIVPDKEEYASVGNLLHPSIVGKAHENYQVKSVRLDDLVEEHSLKPAVIKVDVEGAEGLVFSGAQRTLSEFRPVVISEISNALLNPMGFKGVEIVAEFEKIGYRVIDPVEPGERPGSKQFGDILCLPS
jgi:FkbM family methyltransferase